MRLRANGSALPTQGISARPLRSEAEIKSRVRRLCRTDERAPSIWVSAGGSETMAETHRRRTYPRRRTKPALRPGRRFVPYPAYEPQTGRSGETSSLENGKEVFARRLRRSFPGSLAISAQKSPVALLLCLRSPRSLPPAGRTETCLLS